MWQNGTIWHQMFYAALVYHSMIYPHINYGLLVWGYECNRITKIQKRAIRVITCSKYNAHTEPLLKALEILRVSDVLHLNAMKFYYKYARKQLPPYFLTFDIIRQGEIHDHDTRQRDRIRVNRTRIKLTERCIRNYLLNEINSVPDHILARIHTHSIQGFSSCLKAYKLNQYEVECNRVNCYVIKLMRALVSTFPIFMYVLFHCFFSLFLYTVGILFVFFSLSCTYVPVHI